MKNLKKITFLSILTAVAIVLSYVEMLIPPIMPSIPGIKLGLSNIIAILLLYKFSYKDAIIVSVLRVCSVALLFGSVLTFAYSLTGALLSLTVMFMLRKTNLFSSLGVSIAGGVTHNLGQIMVAILITNTLQIGYYAIVLIITGTLSGAFIGILGSLLIKYSAKFKI